MKANDLARELKGHKTGNGWIARCPAHNDKNPSLSINEGEDGKVLIKCHAGCTQDAVIAKLKEMGLWNDGKGEGRVSTPSKTLATVQPHSLPGLTLVVYATEKCLPVEFLSKLGISEISYQNHPAVRIPYLDESESEIAVRFRIGLTGENKFRWRTGSKPAPYGLWRLDNARRAGYIILVEGESDCHTLWLHDFPALGIPGANNWKEAWSAYLDGIETVYVVIEPDQGGEAVKQHTSKSSFRHRARLIDLGEFKDSSSLYLNNPEQFIERFKATLEASIPWVDIEKQEVEQLKAAAWNDCAELAQKPEILAEFVADLKKLGMAGEEINAKLLYLAFTSRLLPRPISVAVKGPSSGGKSFLVEKVAGFLPANATYALSAMSERALAYMDEPLAHRHLILYEAAGLSSDFASYLVRSLLSEGRVDYQTVEKTAEGLRPRHIEVEGPTGLIVTTTKVSLHPENETKLLTINVNDTADQTRKILEAMAVENDRTEMDMREWHALQDWLVLQEYCVTIPFARALVDLIPPNAVRLRRDVQHVLTLIRSHALLHVATREKDDRGYIIATLKDYMVVYELVKDLIAIGVGALVTKDVREVVEAVANLNQRKLIGVTYSQVATELKLHKATVHRRVLKAMKDGYIRNMEERRGQPARLILGEPLPEEVAILPAPDLLRRAVEGCTVASKSEEAVPSPSLLSEKDLWEGDL